jgi:ferritin-like metal-binding protein YciE
MSTVTTHEELFVHELQDVYYAEKALTKTLPTLAEEASDRELSRAFTSHLKETEQQIQNLEKVFEQIGESAKAHPCPGIEGIKKEHDDFMQESKPTPEITDAFLTGAGARAEHYEIAAYTGLVAKARALGEREAVGLLQENLKQEKEALRKLETIEKRLLKEQNGNGSSRSGSKSSSSKSRTSVSKGRSSK